MRPSAAIVALLGLAISCGDADADGCRPGLDDDTGGEDSDDAGHVDHHDGPPWTEDCSNGMDDDVDGLVDCEDGDCADVAPCAEDCATPADDDGDGLFNCVDDDCWSSGACLFTARVRRGGVVQWYVCHGCSGARFGGGTATSIDGTLRVLPVAHATTSVGPISCAWHADRVVFSSYRFRPAPFSSFGAVRTLSVSPGCPLPAEVRDLLPMPIARGARVAGWSSDANGIVIGSWYGGEPILLSSHDETWHGHDVGYDASWSMSPIEPGSTFEVMLER